MIYGQGVTLIRNARRELYSSCLTAAVDLGIPVIELAAYELGRAYPISPFKEILFDRFLGLTVEAKSHHWNALNGPETRARIERSIKSEENQRAFFLRDGIPCSAYPHCHRLAEVFDGHGMTGIGGEERAWCNVHILEARGAWSILRGGVRSLIEWARVRAGLPESGYERT
jgi:hypothetical protein